VTSSNGTVDIVFATATNGFATVAYGVDREDYRIATDVECFVTVTGRIASVTLRCGTVDVEFGGEHC